METIETENWIADIAASCGGNLYRLCYKPLELEVLRTPQSITDLTQEPELYGIPVLFTPNRIDQGKFTFEGRSYQLPLNEPHRNNHLHGMALGKKWNVAEQSPSHIKVKFDYTATAGFPHDFTLTLSYRFEQNFVKQEISLLNKSDENMPYGLGFHTCFNCTDVDRIYVTADGRWEVLPPRFLPTGKFTSYDSVLLSLSVEKLTLNLVLI